MTRPPNSIYNIFILVRERLTKMKKNRARISIQNRNTKLKEIPCLEVVTIIRSLKQNALCRKLIYKIRV